MVLYLSHNPLIMRSLRYCFLYSRYLHLVRHCIIISSAQKRTAESLSYQSNNKGGMCQFCDHCGPQQMHAELLLDIPLM